MATLRFQPEWFNVLLRDEFIPTSISTFRSFNGGTGLGGGVWNYYFFFFFLITFLWKLRAYKHWRDIITLLGGGGEIFKKFLFRDDISLFVYEMKMEAGKKKGKLGSYSFRRCLNIWIKLGMILYDALTTDLRESYIVVSFVFAR